MLSACCWSPCSQKSAHSLHQAPALIEDGAALPLRDGTYLSALRWRLVVLSARMSALGHEPTSPRSGSMSASRFKADILRRQQMTSAEAAVEGTPTPWSIKAAV